MHPYNGQWFNWLAKFWVTVTCTLDTCTACKTDTFICERADPGDIGHMISARLLTRTTDR